MSDLKRFKLLMVDDDPNLLAGFRRSLGRKFNLTTAEGGARALEVMHAAEPFALVITDMGMPGMSGVEFIKEARPKHKNTVYMMLTGNADQDTAVAAINEGNIFRFLNKPCSTAALEASIAAGFRQYELVIAEQELLRDTLAGCIRALVEALQLTTPRLAARQNRIKSIARSISQRVDAGHQWQLDLAASLCLVGMVVVPSPPGDALTEDLLVRCSEAGARLIRHVPRLDGVSRIIERQREASAVLSDGTWDTAEGAIDVYAQVLRLAIDLDQAIHGGLAWEDALKAVCAPPQRYHPRLIEAAQKCEPPLPATADVKWQKQSLPPKKLKAGMILDQDLATVDGSLLLAKGHELSATAVTRIQNFNRLSQLSDGDLAVLVVVTEEACPAA